MFRRLIVSPAIVAACALGMTSCATSMQDGRGSDATGRVVEAAASINAWGSILAQLGGEHVHATSIITKPDTDPHDYEPTPADGRTIAAARLFIENGVGYDSWAAKAIAANPSGRAVIDVGKLVGVAGRRQSAPLVLTWRRRKGRRRDHRRTEGSRPRRRRVLRRPAAGLRDTPGWASTTG